MNTKLYFVDYNYVEEGPRSGRHKKIVSVPEDARIQTHAFELKADNVYIKRLYYLNNVYSLYERLKSSPNELFITSKDNLNELVPTEIHARKGCTKEELFREYKNVIMEVEVLSTEELLLFVKNVISEIEDLKSKESFDVYRFTHPSF